MSWQWRMMQNLKRNWLVSSKLTWGIWGILIWGLKNLKNLHFNGILLNKVYYVWTKKVEKCMKTQSRKCMSLKFTGEVCVTTVEALRKRLSAKWKKTSRFWIVDLTYLITEQLNWSHTQFLCAWIGHVHSAYMRNIKEAVITVITRG